MFFSNIHPDYCTRLKVFLLLKTGCFNADINGYWGSLALEQQFFSRKRIYMGEQDDLIQRDTRMEVEEGGTETGKSW